MVAVGAYPCARFAVGIVGWMCGELIMVAVEAYPCVRPFGVWHCRMDVWRIDYGGCRGVPVCAPVWLGFFTLSFCRKNPVILHKNMHYDNFHLFYNIILQNKKDRSKIL